MRRHLERILVAIAFFILLQPPLYAIDRLEIDWNRDVRYLPMQIDTISVSPFSEARRLLVRPLQLFGSQTSDDTEPLLVEINNPSAAEDLPAHVTFVHANGLETWHDRSFWCSFDDFTVYFDTEAKQYAVAATGFRNDSAYVIKHVPYDDSAMVAWIPIASGTDKTGNGRWEGSFVFVGQFDYDFDGRTELFFHLNAVRDIEPRMLVCLEMEDARVEWTLEHPGGMGPGKILSWGDSKDPRVVCISYCGGHNLQMSRYTSNLSYLTCINARGEIVWDYVSGVFGTDGFMERSPWSDDLYVYHSHPLSDPETTSVTMEATYHLSLIGQDGIPRHTAALPEALFGLWNQEYGANDVPCVWTLSRTGVIRVYDSTLQQLAESEPTNLCGFVGKLPPVDRGRATLVFRSDERTELFRDDLSKLGSIPLPASYAEAMRVGSDGRLRSLILGNQTVGLTGRIVPRGITDHLKTAYLDYRQQILVLLSGMTVGLVMLNYKRHRVSSQKRQLEIAHKELAETHNQLKRTQQQLIEAEKYKQAKDIAGGFAHEIRNALFPAEASLTRIRRTIATGAGDTSGLDPLVQASSKAVHRAISLTELISQYTKLDTAPEPELTCLKTVVAEVLSANSERIQSQQVAVDVHGPDSAQIRILPLHLYTVLNNLVVNGLDALCGCPAPRLTIVWAQSDMDTHIECTDNGSGITAADCQRIFDPFFSTKPSTGTGLGLAIVRKVITLYGGTITVESEPEQGTSFTVVLPKQFESIARKSE